MGEFLSGVIVFGFALFLAYKMGFVQFGKVEEEKPVVPAEPRPRPPRDFPDEHDLR